MSTRVSVTRLSEAMNLTPRRVQQLVSEGLPKGKRGEYELEDCLMWYIRYLQAKVTSGRPEGGQELSGKDRLDNAKAEQAEYELAAMRRETVAITEAERAWADIVTPARHELLALEAKLRPVIGPEHAALLGHEVKRCLRELASTEAEP
jgi:phage terminase Nu1 subunit (DNA packaging protein)